MKPINNLYLMPTGEAEIIKKLKHYYLVRFEAGEEIYIPIDVIDRASQNETAPKGGALGALADSPRGIRTSTARTQENIISDVIICQGNK